ncbi:MAG TPA: ArnT family glycosyltransferase [Candidatus Tripitaka californicus]|uniref:ArnT family glycosyltransferase n=1 Tax=Candidatus Tripitaka californicus TaxID=3367616 RepID=UPI004025B594|nr:glycosyltransferase family 39 protein [Planctomycetota bacterium]
MRFAYIRESFSRVLSLKLALVVICLTLYLPHLGGRDLWAGRETLYAQVARETLQGNWIVPHFNGEIYFNKPPLYFWVIALLSKPWGDVTEFTLRLPSALAAIGTVLVVFSLGEVLIGAGGGFLAGLILASSPEFQKYACVAKLEMLLTFFVTASLACFYFGLDSASHKPCTNKVRGKRWYFLWGWAFLALSVFTKGIGILIIPPVLGLYLLSRRELYRWREMEPFLGGLLFVSLLLCWLLPAQLYGGISYTGGLVGHFKYHVGKPANLFKPVFYTREVLAGTLPWSLILIGLYAYWKRSKAEERDPLRFPAVWFLATFILFSISMEKRSRYLLPLYPALALMLGTLWNYYISRAAPLWTWERWATVLAFGFCGGSFLGLVYAGLPVSWIVLLVGLCVLALMLLALWSRQYMVLFGSLFLFAMAFETTYCQLVLPRESHAGQERALCQEILQVMEPGASLTTYQSFNQDYVWYMKGRVKELSSREGLLNFFSSSERVYCLTDEEALPSLGSEADVNKTNVYKVKEFQRPGKYGGKLLLLSNRP